MSLHASDIVRCTRSYNSREISDLDIYDELDICTTAEHLRRFRFKEAQTLVKKESPQKEKQISVDPISLRESSRREASFHLMLPPPIATAPQQQPPKPSLINCRLPSSACFSPRFSFNLLKKKLKNDSHASPRQIDKLSHSHLFAQQEIQLRRSKSCAEGRSCPPSDELDFFFKKPNYNVEHESTPRGNISKIGAKKLDDHDQTQIEKSVDPIEGQFKCGALCLYIPGFGRGKPVRPKRAEAVAISEMGNVMSRTVSLEKFECGSWASSAVTHDHIEDGDSMNLYFDLPLELIQNTGNDATSPVAAAFVFDKDNKGVLKNNSTRLTSRKSHESSRHVRFSKLSSASNPGSPASCITPRLRKARDDFNAFLQAQNA